MPNILRSCVANVNASSLRQIRRTTVNMACAITILIGSLSAQQRSVEVQPTVSADIEPPDPALAQVPEDPHLPRVLIMGDSISMGYTWEVRKQLVGKANVQHPDVNCGATEFGVEHAGQWLGGKHWDVIYFNFGLHDLKYLNDKGDYVTPDQGKQVASITQYQENLKKIVATLQGTGAKLIFATTTPVPSGATGRVRYNAAAIQIMREHGVEVDDLWSLVNPMLSTLQQPRNVHFGAEGYRVLGAEAASRIEHDLPNGSRP
jgi:hypothetical protein